MFQSWRMVNNQLSTTQKIVILSVSAGAALLAFVAQCLKRRRKAPTSIKVNKKIRQVPISSATVATSPNGERASQTGSQRSGSPSIRSFHRQPSVLSTLSDRLSAAGLTQGAVKLTPQQLGTMGKSGSQRRYRSNG